MGLNDQVTKLIQIIRSSPSVIAPLIGFKKPGHVEQDIKVADIPPLNNKEYLSLEQVVNLAKQVGGNDHGFRFIQLPYNLAYSEALLLKNQSVGTDKNMSILEAAGKLNVKVFTSIPLFQSRLLGAKIPDYMGLNDQVTKLIQIIRSSPSVIAPLIGFKKPAHVEQDIKVADIPPLNNKEFTEAVSKLLQGNP
jgi:predicted aldo/keto reductase-like oxidoreductase